MTIFNHYNAFNTILLSQTSASSVLQTQSNAFDIVSYILGFIGIVGLIIGYVALQKLKTKNVYTQKLAKESESLKEERRLLREQLKKTQSKYDKIMQNKEKDKKDLKQLRTKNHQIIEEIKTIKDKNQALEAKLNQKIALLKERQTAATQAALQSIELEQGKGSTDGLSSSASTFNSNNTDGLSFNGEKGEVTQNNETLYINQINTLNDKVTHKEEIILKTKNTVAALKATISNLEQEKRNMLRGMDNIKRSGAITQSQMMLMEEKVKSLSQRYYDAVSEIALLEQSTQKSPKTALLN